MTGSGKGQVGPRLTHTHTSLRRLNTLIKHTPQHIKAAERTQIRRKCELNACFMFTLGALLWLFVPWGAKGDERERERECGRERERERSHPRTIELCPSMRFQAERNGPAPENERKNLPMVFRFPSNCEYGVFVSEEVWWVKESAERTKSNRKLYSKDWWVGKET